MRTRKKRSDSRPLVSVVCDHCGKATARKPYRVQIGPIYCSRSCSGSAKKGKKRAPHTDQDGMVQYAE